MTPQFRHVVLGGSCVIGRETVRALLDHGHVPMSVGRRPSDIDGAQSAIADLRAPDQVVEVLRGADVAYLVAGLPYDARVWERQWPLIVRACIDAALENGTHLVYLDNVYAYGRVVGPMAEDTPVRPARRKGRVRAHALEMLEDARLRGLAVTIGRSADFYGPGASTSVFNTFALDRIAAGKKPSWLFNADQPHSMSYTPDIGAGLIVLGTNDDARGGTWHLPTAPALSGREYLAVAAGGPAPIGVMGIAALRFGALFSTPARETLEMAYQYTAPYQFDSRAFENTFGVSATPTAEGITIALAACARPD
ncbi:MAG: NAD-dependent epimerase/dehydratase family protein [Microbacterium sp.]|uniref:NAD-dependent epimerase/dehydratase family protein n=1 Tax=Microbacterium sp. TaxID=51671 RepID=UPI003A88DE0F